MLKGKQLRAIEMLVKGDKKDSEIAEALAIGARTLSRWKNEDAEFKKEYVLQMNRSLNYASAKAFRKQVALLNSESDMVAHLAAKDILDRGGFKAGERIKITAAEEQFDDGFMEALKGKAAEVWEE